MGTIFGWEVWSVSTAWRKVAFDEGVAAARREKPLNGSILDVVVGWNRPAKLRSGANHREAEKACGWNVATVWETVVVSGRFEVMPR